ncbi:AI-2E family transporter [Clostridium tetani]|uniref:AI-2E family transporter n=1 Tax=Clostridium tetani TaxID=1513 RepID=A0ABY0EP31_CLOTA|nr:AI-2E family transporter [Clostridium tetani]CDI49123.1 permease [Clostridium tetani 12124569]KHO39667.1 permease [Clostridium tetani]RXI38667.1 AI-2E family transporter [Clostridium tetani]RXI55474.1 AI-2E family transporter [Clostridium tetani]RXI68545.1 AI-2E family transporter [Clostridium tetani]
MDKIYKKIILYVLIGLVIAIIFNNSIFRDILKLIIISFVIAYILKPVKEILVKVGIKDGIASFITMFSLIILVVIFVMFLIPSLFRESNNIIVALDRIQMFLDGAYDKIKPLKNNKMGIELLHHIYSKIDTIINKTFMNIFDKTVSLGENIMDIFIIPIIAYYFLVDWKKINSRLIVLFPMKIRTVVQRIMKDIDKILTRYIVVQIILSALIGAVTFILLILLKVDFPILLSVINAFFNIIPYFGPILGSIPAILVALTISTEKALWTAICLYLIQQIEGNIISPKFIGDNISMHPLLIIILLIIGGELWGVLGMILAIPLGVIIKVIYEDLNYYIF